VRDALVTLGLSLGLASLLTSYVGTVYGLLWRPPRWRALVTLVCPVMTPVWALQERMTLRGVGFVLGAAVYALAAWDAFRRQ